MNLLRKYKLLSIGIKIDKNTKDVLELFAPLLKFEKVVMKKYKRQTFFFSNSECKMSYDSGRKTIKIVWEELYQDIEKKVMTSREIRKSLKEYYDSLHINIATDYYDVPNISTSRFLLNNVLSKFLSEIYDIDITDIIFVSYNEFVWEETEYHRIYHGKKLL